VIVAAMSEAKTSRSELIVWLRHLLTSNDAEAEQLLTDEELAEMWAVYERARPRVEAAWLASVGYRPAAPYREPWLSARRRVSSR
jgi:hypothetical protein